MTTSSADIDPRRRDDRRRDRADRPPGRQRTRGSAPIAALPGATTTSFMPGSPASFHASACSRAPEPTISVRVGAVIDRRRHAIRAAGCRRIGRQARSIVCVRSGPTETSTIGTPARSSSGADVAPGVLGQVGERPDVVDRLGPAIEPLVDRRRAREHLGGRGPAIDPPAVDLVRHAQRDRREPGQDVDLVEHDAAHRVDGDRVADRHGVEPADAPRAGPWWSPPRGRARGCPAPISSVSSVGNGPEPTRVA